MTQNLTKQKAIQISCEDNMQLMARYPDDHFDLAIVDPPYGIGRSKGIGKRKREVVFTKYQDKKWDKSPPKKEYFNQLMRVSKNQIIFGANYFGIPFSKFIIWDKKIGDNDFAMAEIASHSFSSSSKIFSCFCGANRNGKNTTRIHPTQKPIALYQWLLTQYAKEGDNILDTHIGSGSIAIAVDSVNKIEKMNLTLVGCEIDQDYYTKTMKRINEKTSWQSLF